MNIQSNDRGEGQHMSYAAQISGEDLNYRRVTLPEPRPAGEQILAAAGFHPPSEYALVAVLPSGDFEDVRLAEPFDLSTTGAERFIAFRTDRLFRFTLDGHELLWGSRFITGATVLKLLGLSDETHELYLDAHGGNPVHVGPGDKVDLDKPGVESLHTRIKPITIIVNGKRKAVAVTLLSFDDIVKLAFDNPPSGDGIQFTIQYTRGPAENPSGSLVEGQSVKIKNKMEFDVTSTNRS